MPSAKSRRFAGARQWLLVIAAAALPCAAQPPAEPEAPRARDPYIGVIADSTVTFIGQEFYRAFMAAWRELPGSDRYSLAIVERPSARWGSLVWIEYANRRVFGATLSPGRRDTVRELGAQAAGIAYENAVDTDAQRLLFRDPDLARDELEPR